MTVIHEFSVPLWVQTPLGEGQAILMTDYGIDHNPVFLVRITSGEHAGKFKSVDANDCRGVENLTYGVKRPDAPRGGEA